MVDAALCALIIGKLVTYKLLYKLYTSYCSPPFPTRSISSTETIFSRGLPTAAPASRSNLSMRSKPRQHTTSDMPRLMQWRLQGKGTQGGASKWKLSADRKCCAMYRAAPGGRAPPPPPLPSRPLCVAPLAHLSNSDGSWSALSPTLGRAPDSASCNNAATVSRASGIFVPTMPLGPRFSHPAQ